MDEKRMHQSAVIASRLSRLASLRLTWVAMLTLVVMIVVARFSVHVGYMWIALPLALLVINLLAALATNVRLRREPALIVFHLALVALCLLAGLDALTRFHGRIELVEGQILQTAEVQVVERGILHRLRLNEVALKQDAIEVEFAPGLIRQRTRSTVSTLDNGREKRIEIGEARPLILLGYRLATTSNKGHAMVLSWLDANGSVMRGAVHFPSYPAQEWRQQRTWHTPAGEPITLALRPHTRPPVDSAWVLRSREVRADATLSAGGASRALVPGKWHQLRGGALRLDEVRLWMGYRIDYQPLMQWMLFAALVGISALAFYFYKRLWRPICDHRPAAARGDSDFMARI
ncbi:MAG: cytochrome c biogenesis protein ResB [Betaproteobacteria bacterium]|jgi:cytochrome c biogenesis protein|nr:MAG: cytochrome c biogenesis protein ResB [Betaproteobacteria bacterium]